MKKTGLAITLLVAVSAAAHAGDEMAASGRTITLDEAVSMGRKSNPSLAASREKPAQAGQLKNKALAGLLPNWSVTGAYFWIDMDYAFVLPPNPYFGHWRFNPDGKNATTASTILNVPILDLSGIWKYQAADIQGSAARRSADAYENEFIYNVTSAYYAALGARKLLDIARESVVVSQSHYDTAKARYDAGDLTRLGYLKAEIDLEKSRQDLRKAENAYAAAREALATVIGTQPEFEVADAREVPAPPGYDPSDPSKSDPGKLLSSALSTRADVAAATLTIRAVEKARQEAAWTRFIPTITGSAYISYTDWQDFNNGYTWFLSLTANWVLYDGGLRYADAKERASAEAEARQTKEALKNTINSQIKQALIEADSCSASLQSARKQLELAKESQSFAEINFKEGVTTPMEVADANGMLVSARTNLAREELNCQLTRLKLLRAMGTIGEYFRQ